MKKYDDIIIGFGKGGKTLAGYLASVSVLAVRSVKALRRGGSRGMLWAGLGLTLLGIVYLALYVCHPFS